MKIRLLAGWNGRSVGYVFDDFPGGMADVLIRRKIAEEIKDDQSHKTNQPDSTPDPDGGDQRPLEDRGLGDSVRRRPGRPSKNRK